MIPLLTALAVVVACYEMPCMFFLIMAVIAVMGLCNDCFGRGLR